MRPATSQARIAERSSLRLTFLVDTPGRRAHGNSVSRLALGLAAAELAETTILCYSADEAPAWLPPQVRVAKLGATRVSRSLPPLIRYLRDEQPDVLISRQVHANFVALAAARIARTPPRWRGKLIVVHDHPIALSHASNWRDNKWVAKVAYRYADGLVSPSPSVREDIIRWCGLDPAAIAVVPNPIPEFSDATVPAPHPWLADQGAPVFVNTSNMTPWKRLDLLIDAFAELRRRHCPARLIIVGDGAGRGGADERIKRLKLDDCATTVGWVDDPLQYAARAWAFVLSSDEEGYAQVLTEAMSTGCPVITTDAEGGGPRFVTDDGRFGMLVPMRDSDKLANAMAAMLHPETRSYYSAAGRQRAGQLSPAASTDKLMNFIAARFGLGMVSQ